MIIKAALPYLTTDYYPLGNTPAVSLTQDLPPELAADILLMGCGDVRHILFTSYVDNARKLDVTCCDIEPGIHARNILLYTLLIDNEASLDNIWSIYYHWKLDKDSFKLLQRQTDKLLNFSKSIDRWHSSLYGESIKFCDENSLLSVRRYWSGFSFNGLSPSDKEVRISEMQNVIDESKSKIPGPNTGIAGIRSALPRSCSDDIMPLRDLNEITNRWWSKGAVLFSAADTKKLTHLNPALLFSPNKGLRIAYDQSPLHGFPLNVGYASLKHGSAFCIERDNSGSITDHLLASVKNIFKQWVCGFMKAVKNKSVIRIFSGDAITFGFALWSCQQGIPTSNCPLNLHRDYNFEKRTAPVMFDVVDTSNLVDYVGPLSLICVASNLLKNNLSSALYTETMNQRTLEIDEWLSNVLCVDIRSMAFFLGIVTPELYTNATNTIEEDLADIAEKKNNPTACKNHSCHVRLRWRRTGRSCNSLVHVEAEALSAFLYHLYETMFKYEDYLLTYTEDYSLLIKVTPTRANFAFVLSILKSRIASNWDKCMAILCDRIFCDSSELSRSHYALDLALHLHVFGVDSSRFPKPPVHLNVINTLLPSALSEGEHVPEQVCVTIRVPKSHLEFFTSKLVGMPFIVCSIESNNPDIKENVNMFSAVQIKFGKWCDVTEKENLNPFIEEDFSRLHGSSDMFASIMVPTVMILHPEQTSLKCQLSKSYLNLQCFGGKLGSDLCIVSKKLTDEDVYITRFMPGMSTFPVYALSNDFQDEPISTTKTMVRFKDDFTKVDTLARRMTLTSDAAKAKLADKQSKIRVDFNSPFLAVVSIDATIQYRLEFPVPVSMRKFKVKIARKSAYIEVESPFFDPLVEYHEAFMFPMFLTPTPNGSYVPVLWTAMRVDLDVFPSLDVRNKRELKWITNHIFCMYSASEYQILESNISADPVRSFRIAFKDTLKDFFLSYASLNGSQQIFFYIQKHGEKFGKGNSFFIIPFCLRMDLANHTVLLDAAIIPVSKHLLADPKARLFFGEELHEYPVRQISVDEVHMHFWRALIPATVERCRTGFTWKHTSSCEYTQANEVPLPESSHESPICSCGIGRFQSLDKSYIELMEEKYPNLRYVLSQYGTRAAIAPIFPLPFVEKSMCDVIFKETPSKKLESLETPVYLKKCGNCGSNRRKKFETHQQKEGLMRCSRCQNISYCSPECQKKDWANHKFLCTPAQGRA